MLALEGNLMEFHTQEVNITRGKGNLACMINMQGIKMNKMDHRYNSVT